MYQSSLNLKCTKVLIGEIALKLAPLLIPIVLLEAISMSCHAQNPATVEDRVAQHGPKARARLVPAFARARVRYPAKAVTLVYIKEQQVLHLYAGDDANHLHFLKTYPVLAASGGPGPKLKEGDEQVPEGIYKIESLNPNSRFHLSLRVNYPNAFDQMQAHKEGRTDLGTNIMIHGKSVSIGCIAIGDLAIEELFVLAAESGFTQWNVLLSPCGTQGTCFSKQLFASTFMGPVYENLRREIANLPLPRS